MQANSIGNTLKKIIAKNFPNLEKELPSMYKKPLGHQTDMTK
jgi:hypothetical protein